MPDHSTRLQNAFGGPGRIAGRIGTIISDYSKCLYFESRLRPAATASIVIRLIRARLLSGVGPYHFSLFRFSEIPEEQWPDYMTDYDFQREVLFRNNTAPARQLVKDKAAFYLHCRKAGIPTIPILWGMAKSDPAGSPLGEMIPLAHDFEGWQALVESSPEELFVKPVDGSHGDGAFTIRRLGEQFVVQCGAEERQLDASELYARFLDGLVNEAGLIVQQRLRAHRKILEISSPHGLATVRAITVMTGEKAGMLLACARLPVGSNICDNFSNGATGNLITAIDIDTGKTGVAWTSNNKYWPTVVPLECHPDTGRPIVGFTIPFWVETVELVVRAQASLPGLRSIGWDIAITEDGPVVVEANGGYDLNLLQVSHRRGLGRELTAAIQEGQVPQ